MNKEKVESLEKELIVAARHLGDVINENISIGKKTFENYSGRAEQHIEDITNLVLKIRSLERQDS